MTINNLVIPWPLNRSAIDSTVIIKYNNAMKMPNEMITLEEMTSANEHLAQHLPIVPQHDVQQCLKCEASLKII